MSYSLFLWLACSIFAEGEAKRIDVVSFSKASALDRHNQLVLLASPDCANTTCGELEDFANDVLYVSDVTVGGQDYKVQLDTGSSDLWVNGSQIPIPNVNLAPGLVVSDVYGDGSNFTGAVGFAQVEFHGYTISNQSFNYATIAENDNVSPFNLTGLIGLSFNGLSLVQQTVKASTGSSTEGQTFLSNVFASQASLDPFITFLLSRENDLNTTATNGAFTISQIEQGFDRINDQTSLPLIPATSVQWTVSVDQVLIGGSAVALSSSVVTGATSGSNVGLLDTGTSSLIMDTTLVNNFYSSIKGAQQLSHSTWSIPCDVEPPSLSFVIGGQTVPIHPLDTNPISTVYQTSGGSLISLCTGGLVGSRPDSTEGFDFLLGAPFLKNTYTLFNYGSTESSTGSNSSQPFVKLLAITDPSNTSADFASTRKAQLALAPAASASQIQSLASGDPSFTPVSTPDLPNTGSSSSSASGSSGSSGNGSSSGGGNTTSGAVSLAVSWIAILCGVLFSL